jgi:hypothetical protein
MFQEFQSFNVSVFWVQVFTSSNVRRSVVECGGFGVDIGIQVSMFRRFNVSVFRVQGFGVDEFKCSRVNNSAAHAARF